MEPNLDYSCKKSGKLGIWATFELHNLQQLTELGCSCTPKLLDFRIDYQIKGDNVPGGFILYLLIEKVPGRNLLNFGSLPMSERDQVRIAFGKAIRYDLPNFINIHLFLLYIKDSICFLQIIMLT